MNRHILRRLPLALAVSMTACRVVPLTPSPQPTLALPTWTPTVVASTSPTATPQATEPGTESPAQAAPTQDYELSIAYAPLEDLRDAGGEPLPSQLSPISPANADRLELLASWGRGTVEKVVHSPDGTLLAVASSRGVYLYDARTLADVRFIPIEHWTYGAAFSPDGRLLAALTEDTTDLYRVEDGGLIWRKELDRFGLRGDVAISPDGRIVASGLGATVYLWDLQQGSLLRRFEATQLDIDEGLFEPTTVQQLQFAMDGRVLAVAHTAPAIDFFEVPSGELLWTQPDTGIGWDSIDGLEAQPIAINADGMQLLYFNGYPESIEFLDLPQGGPFSSRSLGLEQLQAQAGSLYIASLALSPSGELLALGNAHYALSSNVGRDAISIVDAANGTLVRALDGHHGPVTTLSFSPDGQTLASGSLDNTVHLWRLSDGALLAARQDHSDEILDLSFSPDGALLAAAMKDRRARLWQVPDGALRYKLGVVPAYGYWYEGHIPGTYALDFSPDGTLLATGSDMDAGLAEWDPATGELSRQVYAGYFGQHTFSLAYLESGFGILVEYGSVGRGTFSELSFVGGEQALAEIPESLPLVAEAFAVSEAGTQLAVASFAGEGVYELANYELVDTTLVERLRLSAEGEAPDMLAFSPDGALLAQAFNFDFSDDQDRAVKVIRLADGREVASLVLSPRSSGGVVGLAFSPDGRLLALALADGQIRVWESANWTQRATLRARLSGGLDPTFIEPRINSHLSFSPDGRLLALGRQDGAVQLWGVPE
ncbi:MAG TPA: PQQ-binding-like beta-propeller repeat protein [Anaerolineales bacterium]